MGYEWGGGGDTGPLMDRSGLVLSPKISKLRICTSSETDDMCRYGREYKDRLDINTKIKWFLYPRPDLAPGTSCSVVQRYSDLATQLPDIAVSNCRTTLYGGDSSKQKLVYKRRGAEKKQNRKRNKNYKRRRKITKPKT